MLPSLTREGDRIAIELPIKDEDGMMTYYRIAIDDGKIDVTIEETGQAADGWWHRAVLSKIISGYCI